MRIQYVTKCITGVVVLLLMFVSAGQAGVVLLSDDLSTLSNFEVDVSNNGTWVSDGTNASYATGDAGADLARLASVSAFDFNPGGVAYDSVTLEFTSSIVGTERLEIGLYDKTSGSYPQPRLSVYSTARAAVVVHNANASPAGLLFNDGIRPAPGSTVDVAMPILEGTNTYKMVFTATGTELFRDGASLGTTTNVLDFTKDYNVVAFAQGNAAARPRSLDNVQLTAAIPEPATVGILGLGALITLLVRRTVTGK